MRILLQIKENVLLSEKTSYRIGGKTRYFIDPKNIQEVIEALKWAKDKSIPIFVLGKGSNILVGDYGWSGLTLGLSELKDIQWNENSAICGAGALLHTLVTQSVDKGFHGIEVLAGIPGSIGGGVVMNAGAFGGNISDYLEDVTVIDLETFHTFKVKKEEMDFGYRTSKAKELPWLIVEACFKFVNDKKNSPDKVKQIYSDIIKKRNIKQPLNLPNCGSVFKRPPNNFAGTLIEECGLKGFTIGGAQISEKHANFIVNRNNASAADIKRIIDHVIKVVFEKKQIKLDPEVIFVGKFKD